MEKNVQAWTGVTKSIFNAVLIFAIGTILYSVFAIFGGAQDFVSSAVSAVGGSTSFNFYNIVKWICIAAMVIGYLMYVMGLGKFGAILKENDSKAIGQVRIGAIILILTSITLFFNIPQEWINWIVRVLELIALVMMLVGFSTLKKSTAIDAKAARGFSTLFIATLLLAIGLVCGWIIYIAPFLGVVMKFIAWILKVVGLIIMIVGWNTVKGAHAK